MLDPNLIREQPDFVKKVIQKKNVDPVIIDRFLEVDAKRKALVKEIDMLRHKRKEMSQNIGKMIAAGEDVEDVKSQVRDIASEIKDKEKVLSTYESEYKDILLRIPNIPDASVPCGKDESENIVVKRWGEIRDFDFTPKPHWEIAEDLDIIDFKRGAKISGARFYVLKGLGAKLERALISFMIDLHVEKHGYREIFPPFLINRASMLGTGQLPKFEEDMYHCEKEDLFLDPTAEVPVTNLHRDEILREEDLPIKYVAYTACFRREAGAAGRDTRGIIRVHQFNKVEMVRFVKPEESMRHLEELIDNAEDVLRVLGLPYQLKKMCTGDLGFTAAIKFDPEVYMPAQDKYVEISSCSNFKDFQARRANIRYRTKDGELRYVHTLNGSGLAVGRTMAALIENYQQKDGSILIPEVLQKYVGTDRITREK
jgi:seryl-tRNA synthetase